MPNRLFITGIGTDVGKTVASSILACAMKADYWKPVQAGDLENSDSVKIMKNSGNNGIIHQEKYRLTSPMSPHASADIDKIKISVCDFSIPESRRDLIIEGAGGLLVPLNERETILDLIKHFDVPVIVVIRHYLGSINHSLLTLDKLETSGIEIRGIVISGNSNHASEDVILKKHSDIPVLRIPELEVNEKNIQIFSEGTEVQNFCASIKKGPSQ